MPPPATTTVRVVIRLKPKANPACDTAVEVVRPDPGAEARAVLMGQQFSKALAPPPRVPLTSPPSLRSSTQAASVVITKPGADVEGVYQVCVRVCARREIWVKKRRRVSPGRYAPARARSRSTPPPPTPHPHTPIFQFPFDAVLGPDASQAALYTAAAADVVAGALAGYHGTVLAYGQTGGGKTYAMTGPPFDPTPPAPAAAAAPPAHLAGIVPRAVEALFTGLAARGGAWAVGATYVEVYNEGLRDLLGGGGGGGK